MCPPLCADVIRGAIKDRPLSADMGHMAPMSPQISAPSGFNDGEICFAYAEGGARR